MNRFKTIATLLIVIATTAIAPLFAQQEKDATTKPNVQFQETFKSKQQAVCEQTGIDAICQGGVVVTPGTIGWRIAQMNARANSHNPETLKKFSDAELQRTENLMTLGFGEETAAKLSNKASKAYANHFAGKGGRVLIGVGAAVAVYEGWKALNSNTGTSAVSDPESAKGAFRTQQPAPQPTPQK